MILKIPRFARMSPQTQRWLVSRLMQRTYKKNEVIFFEGDECSSFFIIESGLVKVCKIIEQGKEVVMDIFHSGEAIGEIALIDGISYPATAIAKKPTMILTLSRSDYFELVEHFPGAAWSMIRDLSCRLRAMSRRVQELSSGGVESRLVQLLNAFGTRIGQTTPNGFLIPMRLNHSPPIQSSCMDSISRGWLVKRKNCGPIP